MICLSLKAQLEASQGEWLEKEIDLEKQITRSEDTMAELKQKMEEKEKELEKCGTAENVVKEKDREVSIEV